MPIVYTAVIYPETYASGRTTYHKPHTLEVWSPHCDPSALLAAQIASESVERDPGLDVFPRWQVFELDTEAPIETADVTADCIRAMVDHLRAANICTDCPPWWQEYDARLCDWELAGWDHERAAEEARADLDEHRRAAIAATGYPFGGA